ncbi:MAG TPA: ABATE domain-containing protein [Ktedonobacteraceae bacterium]|jgi:predicted RNA-binding Zn ribbon-like protein
MSETAINDLATFEFSFSGDHLCLDFTNTLDNRMTEKPTERLKTYPDLLSWCVQAELITPEQATRLREMAQRAPLEAERVLAQAIELRELMRRIFLASAEERLPADEDLKLLSAKFVETMAKGQLAFTGQQYAWQWPITEGMLDGLFGFIIPAAIELLTSRELSLVRICAAEDCGWLFLDVSKNHSRRWCDMKSCGNRAKVRKFYQTRATKASPSA